MNIFWTFTLASLGVVVPAGLLVMAANLYDSNQRKSATICFVLWVLTGAATVGLYARLSFDPTTQQYAAAIDDFILASAIVNAASVVYAVVVAFELQ